MAEREMEDWTGEVGDRWLAHIDRFEGMLSLLHQRLADTIGPCSGEKVLDIGCGGGPLAFMLAKTAEQVTGLDVAPQLISLADQRAATSGRSNISFEIGDAASTIPDNSPFDRLVSAFGVMFFEDSQAAFQHLHSLANPEAALQFYAWAAPDRNPWMGLVMEVIGNHAELPERDPDEPGPFRFADADATRAMITEAGFSDVTVEPVEQLQPLGGLGASVEEAIDFVMAALDMDTLLADQGIDRGPIVSELQGALAPHASGDGVMLPGCALYYSAKA